MNYIVKWSEEDTCYICTSLDYPSVKTHGGTVEDAVEEMKIVMEEL